MKKVKKSSGRRPEYKRSDFGVLTRGKYVGRLKKSSNVVVIDPGCCRRVSKWRVR